VSHSFGTAYRVTLFGSSHGSRVGAVIEGLPIGFAPDTDALHAFLTRRKPQSVYDTARRESDEPEFAAGLTDGAVSSQRVVVNICNNDIRTRDYVNLKHTPRPGHADYPAMVKYGNGYETGGGEFSGRMTAPLCVAGGLAMQVLAKRGIEISAHVVSIGGKCDGFDDTIAAARAEGDSVGGVIECQVTGLPVGLGGALFDGLESRISAAVFGIPAVKGIEFGAGFASAAMRGSENNDAYCIKDGAIQTETNHAGGILGGMANGMPLTFRAAFKPTPSIAKPQKTVNLETMSETEISVSGRHDACIVPRAVPCVEAAAACALLDALLEQASADGLAALRTKLDCADRALLRAFDERMVLSQEIGLLKKAQGLPVPDASREAEKLAAVSSLSANPEAAEELYRLLMRLSREEQERL